MGAHVERHHDRAARLSQDDVGFGDAADAGLQNLHADLVGGEAAQGLRNRLDRALDVALDDDGQNLLLADLTVFQQVFHRRAARRGGTGLAALARAEVGDLAGARIAFHNDEFIAGFRRALKTEHFDRLGRAGGGNGLALIVDEGAHAAPLAAGDDDVADLDRAALDENRGDRTAALVELGLDDRALGRAIGIGHQLKHFGLQQNGFFQLVEAGLLERRDFHGDHVAAHLLDDDLVAQQFLLHAVGVGVRLVDLVDRHDDRHARRLGVGDRFFRLRHDAVIGRDDQNDDVGHLRAAGAHRGERGVAGRVEEGDLGP